MAIHASSEVPDGYINVRDPIKKKPERKEDLTEEDVLSTLFRKVDELHKELIAGDRNDGWYAIVMRVDSYKKKYARVKARIPEKDIIPEPTEYLKKEISSKSHCLIEMHRTYVGRLDSEPKVGDLIFVTIPGNNSTLVKGKILGTAEEKGYPGLKSSEKEDAAPTPTSARGASTGGRTGGGSVTTPAGGGSAAGEVPPPGTTPEEAAQQQSLVDQEYGQSVEHEVFDPRGFGSRPVETGPLTEAQERDERVRQELRRRDIAARHGPLSERQENLRRFNAGENDSF